MTVCYFGTYDRYRPRNRIMINTLRKNGVEVLECHFSPWLEVEDKSQIGKLRWLSIGFRFLWAYFFLVIRYLTIGRHDIVVVGYLGHFDMFIARPLAFLRKKPLIFDAFLSLYDTVVEDRKLLKPYSLLARFLFWIDRTACRFADLILLDTQSHIDYFVKTFDLCREKFHRVFVGAEEDLFYPCENDINQDDFIRPFQVLFYGQFIPLHGIEIIVKAAKLIESEGVKFALIGKGQESAKIHSLIKELNISNIRWIEWVPYTELRRYICQADVGLGIFGNTEKTRRVIPNKAFQILACRRPLITGDSPAVRELLANGESALLCAMADPEALAQSILCLKKDALYRKKISEEGYRVFNKIVGVSWWSRFSDSVE